MSNQLICSGVVIHEGVVEYYDFAQLGSTNVQQPSFVMRKGDTIRTTCYYNTTEHLSFGLGSSDEMCIGLYGYYPKQAIPSNNCVYLGKEEKSSQTCSASYSRTSINEDDLGRSFAVDPGQCTTTASDEVGKKASFFVKSAKDSPLFLPLVLVVAANAVVASIIIYRSFSEKVHYRGLSMSEAAA